MRKVSGRFVLTGVSGAAPGPWNIDGNFFDSTGNYGPGDVQPGMALFFYDATQGTIRFRITNINSGSNPLNFDVVWDDTPGTELDPPLDTGAICAINLSSSTPEEPSYTLQFLPEELVSGIRAQTNRKPIEEFGWRKFNAVFGDFAVGAATNQIPLFDLQPNQILEKVVVKHNTSFLGGSISSYEVSVGLIDVGQEERYLSNWDVFQAPGDAVQLTSSDDRVESVASPTTVYLRALSQGDNLDQATQGDLYVLIKLGTIQD